MNASRGRWLGAAFCGFGWLSSFSYPLHLVGPHLHPCTDGDALPYLVSMLAGPATLAMAAALLVVGAGLGVAVRWPALLHVGTLAIAVFLLPDYLVNTTYEGRFVCSSNAAGGPLDFATAPWQRAYVPVHNAALVLFGGFCLWYWRRFAPDRGEPGSATRRAGALATALVLLGGAAPGARADSAAPEPDSRPACLERPMVVVYLNHLQDRIMEYWVVPEDSLTDQEVVVRFQLAADGSFMRTQLVSSTNTRIANGVELALRYAGPFGIVPPEAECIIGRPIEIHFQNPY